MFQMHTARVWVRELKARHGAAVVDQPSVMPLVQTDCLATDKEAVACV